MLAASLQQLVKPHPDPINHGGGPKLTQEGWQTRAHARTHRWLLIAMQTSLAHIENKDICRGVYVLISSTRDVPSLAKSQLLISEQ